MPFYYLSFCDITRPEGTQFLGATVIEAIDAKDAHAKVTANGTNPGGEIAIMELNIQSADELDEAAKRYLNKFVPRKVVMAEAFYTMEDIGRDVEASVCQRHNPTSSQ